MGVLDSLASGVSSEFGNVKNQLNPSSLIGAGGGFNIGSTATDLIGGSMAGTLSGVMGIEDCPGGAGGNIRPGSTDNDPCGGADNALKKAVLGLGMASAAPTIASAGSMMGDTLDSELGKASSFLGEGIISGVDTLGMSEENSSIMSDALGVGVGGAIGGANAAESTTSAISSGIINITNKNISESSDNTSKNMFENVKDMSVTV